MNEGYYTRFLDLLDRLRVRDVRARLPAPLADGPPPPDARDRDFGHLIASRLAFGVDAVAGANREVLRRHAYEATTKLAESGDETDRLAADMILARLGHFPSRGLLRLDGTAGRASVPPALAVEAMVREVENTVRPAAAASALGRTEVLTDVQCRLYEAFGRSRPTSASAPTSAGKSFVLTLDIVRELASRAAQGLPCAVVYLVPTRALIRQVQADVVAQLRRHGLGDAVVTAAPVPVDAAALRAGIVYVLTQERLMSLLSAADADLAPRVDVLYVDEAQELEDDERGLLLHTAVSRVLAAFPRATVHFASPLTENPAFLLTEFALDRDGEFFTTEESPVGQTLVLLGEVKGKPSRATVRVIGTRATLDVGVTELRARFRDVRQKLAAAAVNLTAADESSIVYANDAHEAEEVATAIAALLPEPEAVDAEVVALIDFLRQHVHRLYGLIDLLPRGVAYHYGAMPHVVRARVEDLVRDGKVRFVCCTSTLLQGVNLPARNLFVQQPTRGRGRAMSPGDFWNLAGRAGRLRHTFGGYVWCIERDGWAEAALAASRLRRVRSAFREALADDEQFRQILTVIGDPNLPAEQQETKVGEQVLAKVVADFTLEGQGVADSRFATDETRDRLVDLDARCRSLVEDVVERSDVPAEVLRRHPTISPWKLRDLWRLFTDATNIRPLMPPDPRPAGAAGRMQELFRRLDEMFFKSGNRSYLYHATLAHRWCRGDTLRELIANRVSYYQVVDSRVNAQIRELLGELEHTLHYKYVKYLRAYDDVLAIFLRASGRDDLLASLVPLHHYVEFGACEPTSLGLMSLGLSRTTTLLLVAAAGLTADLERDELLEQVRRINLRSLVLPELCLREIEGLFILAPVGGAAS